MFGVLVRGILFIYSFLCRGFKHIIDKFIHRIGNSTSLVHYAVPMVMFTSNAII